MLLLYGHAKILGLKTNTNSFENECLENNQEKKK